MMFRTLGRERSSQDKPVAGLGSTTFHGVNKAASSAASPVDDFNSTNLCPAS
jgi:hypothetical protein